MFVIIIPFRVFPPHPRGGLFASILSATLHLAPNNNLPKLVWRKQYRYIQK